MTEHTNYPPEVEPSSVEQLHPDAITKGARVYHRPERASVPLWLAILLLLLLLAAGWFAFEVFIR